MRKLFVRVLLPSVAMLLAAGAHARVAELRIERLAQAAVTAENLALQLSWPAAATDGKLQASCPSRRRAIRVSGAIAST